MNKFLSFLKAILATPELSRMIPTFYDNSFPGFDNIKKQQDMTASEVKKMHKEQLALMAAQIDEQRQANQHNLLILHRTLILSAVGTSIATLSLMVAISAVIVTALK